MFYTQSKLYYDVSSSSETTINILNKAIAMIRGKSPPTVDAGFWKFIPTLVKNTYINMLAVMYNL